GRVTRFVALVCRDDASLECSERDEERSWRSEGGEDLAHHGRRVARGRFGAKPQNDTRRSRDTHVSVRRWRHRACSLLCRPWHRCSSFASRANPEPEQEPNRCLTLARCRDPCARESFVAAVLRVEEQPPSPGACRTRTSRESRAASLLRVC